MLKVVPDDQPPPLRNGNTFEECAKRRRVFSLRFSAASDELGNQHFIRDAPRGSFRHTAALTLHHNPTFNTPPSPLSHVLHAKKVSKHQL